MTKDYQLATVLTQAGIKSDDVTGSLVSPIHLSTTYQHPEFGNQQVMIIPEQKILPEQR